MNANLQIALLLFATTITVYPIPPSPTLLSTHAVAVETATPAGNSFAGTPSANGRFVLFTSDAPDLVAGDVNGIASDVFLRDLGTTNVILVSRVLHSHTSGNGASRNQSMSADANWIVFESDANDLVSNETNDHSDIFLHNRTTEATILISRSSEARVSANGISRNPIITSDGTRVFFESFATNLLDEPSSATPQIYVYEIASGELSEIPFPENSAEFSYGPPSESISVNEDGTLVSWIGHATSNAVGDSIRVREVFISDLVTTRVLPRVSTVMDGFSEPGNTPVYNRTHSATNLSFRSTQETSVVAPTYGTGFFRYEWETGILTAIGTPDEGKLLKPAVYANMGDASGPSISSGHRMAVVESSRYVADGPPSDSEIFLVDLVSDTATSIDFGTSPVISPDERYVAYVSAPENDSAPSQLILHDTSDGSSKAITSAVNSSVSAIGTANPGVVFNSGSTMFTFQSRASDLIEDDGNDCYDVFAYDIATESLELVSRIPTSFPSWKPIWLSGLEDASVSDDGQWVVFTSLADDLVPDDGNGVIDCLIANTLTGEVALISRRSDGGSADRGGYGPKISGNGTRVIFESTSTDLVPDYTPELRSELYLYDVASGEVSNLLEMIDELETFPITTYPNFDYHLSRDGDSLLFSDSNFAASAIQRHYRFSTGTYQNLPEFGASPRGALSASGEFAAYFVRFDNFQFVDTSTRIVTTVETPSSIHISSRTLIKLSESGSFALASTEDRNGRSLILFDAKNASMRYLAHGDHFSPFSQSEAAFSRDEQFVVFSTRSSPNSRVSHVYLVSTSSGDRELISIDRTGKHPADGLSHSPSVSADGRFVAFESSATDLVFDDAQLRNAVYVRDRKYGFTRRITPADTLHEFLNLRPQFSLDGRTVISALAGIPTVTAAPSARELVYFGLPGALVGDSDLDMLDDDWEVAQFHDLSRNGTGDLDLDSLLDVDEFRIGSNPHDPFSGLEAEVLGASDATILIRWPELAGRICRVVFRDAIAGSGWTDLPASIEVSDGFCSTTDSTIGDAIRFYRIIID